jgi:hypothetical protein
MLKIAITRIAPSHSDMEYASGLSDNLTAQDKGDGDLSEKCTHGLVDGLTAVWD